MMYVIAFLFPPLALLLIGRPFAAILNGLAYAVGIALTPVGGLGLIVIIACLVHAVSAVGAKRQAKMERRLGRTMAGGGWRAASKAFPLRRRRSARRSSA